MLFISNVEVILLLFINFLSIIILIIFLQIRRDFLETQLTDSKSLPCLEFQECKILVRYAKYNNKKVDNLHIE